MTDRRLSAPHGEGIRSSPSQAKRTSISSASTSSARSTASQASSMSRSRRMSRIRSNFFVGIWQTAHDLRIIDLKKIDGTWYITVQPYDKMDPITVPLGEEPQCDPSLRHYFTAEYGHWETDATALKKLKRNARLQCMWTESWKGELQIQGLRWLFSLRPPPTMRRLEDLLMSQLQRESVGRLDFASADGAKGTATNACTKKSR